MPKVTILLPTRQSEKYLQETIKSVLMQTFEDFELLVVDDASTDRTLSILRKFRDERIRVIRGPERGLARALNVGLKSAKGVYVARIDADDIMVPHRIATQVAFMDANRDVVICGGWQQYFGMSSFLHAPPESAEQCKANLLFRCDLCHSTLMLRKEVFLNNQLFYDDHFAAEDYELWTRVLRFGEIRNIQAILGYYREDGKSITSEKKQQLISQNGEIVAASLKQNLGIELTDRQKRYFTGWTNPFFQLHGGIKSRNRQAAWLDLRELLFKIVEKNRKVRYYDEQCLLKTVDAEWGRLRYNLPFLLPKQAVSLSYVFRRRNIFLVMMKKASCFCKNYKGIKRKYYKIKSSLSVGKMEHNKGDIRNDYYKDSISH